MRSKPYKKKLQRDALTSLARAIEMLLLEPPDNDDDKLHYAVLSEVHGIAEKRLSDIKDSYHISFTSAQALSLRILFNDYVKTKTTYTGNLLHQISLEVHQQYQL